MAVLLVGPREDVAEALIERLIEQGDDARVIERDGAAAQGWRSLGAHVAVATDWDADLIERAATGARTIVLFESEGRSDELVEETLRGAGFAGADRIVLVTSSLGGSTRSLLEKSSLSFVVLQTGVRRRGLINRRATLEPSRMAEAIDAADDLAGDPRLILDLGVAEAWQTLNLPPGKEPG